MYVFSAGIKSQVEVTMSEIKKLSAILLSMTLVATLFTACTSKGETNESQENTTVTGLNYQKAEDEVETIKKPDSIHWMVHSGMKKENGTDIWVSEFETFTGIDLNLDIVLNNQYDTILDIAFSSGNAPDVFDLSGEQKLATYVSQGAVADLTNLVKESELYGKVEKEVWDSVRINGKIYGIPDELASGTVTYFRKDWLDRLGLSEPKNYDEFIEVLRAFRDNIEECEVPLTAPGLRSNQYLPEFYQGATPDFIKVDGVWVDGFAMDNMAEAMQRMKDAYREKLIDMQVVTNTTTYCREKWYKGIVGVFNYWAGNWGQTLKERLQLNVPDATVLAIAPIEEAVYRYSVPNVICISSKLSNDKIAGIYKYFLEYMHDGGEGQILFESGVEGVHWEQDGEYIKQLPSISNPEENFRKAWITPWMAISPLKVTDKKIELDESVIHSLDILSQYGVRNTAFPVSDTFNKIINNLNLLREEILAKVVMGTMSVEEGMHLYKTKSAQLRVDRVLKEMNEE